MGTVNPGRSRPSMRSTTRRVVTAGVRSVVSTGAVWARVAGAAASE